MSLACPVTAGTAPWCWFWQPSQSPDTAAAPMRQQGDCPHPLGGRDGNLERLRITCI